MTSDNTNQPNIYVQNVTPAPIFVQATPPSIAPTLAITICFGIFGIIPAFMAAEKAKALGLATSKYWGAFWIPMACYTTLFFLFVMMAASGA